MNTTSSTNINRSFNQEVSPQLLHAELQKVITSYRSKVETIQACLETLTTLAYAVYDPEIPGLELYFHCMQIADTFNYMEDIDSSKSSISYLKVLAQTMRYRKITQDPLPIFDNGSVGEERKDTEDEIAPSIPYQPIEVSEEDLDEALKKSYDLYLKNFSL